MRLRSVAAIGAACLVAGIVAGCGSSSTNPSPGSTATTTTLSSSSATVAPGGTATVTAKVTAQNGMPVGGNVVFLLGSTQLGTTMLGNGTAALTVTSSQLTFGTNSITAQYTGQGDFQGSTSTALSLTQQTSVTVALQLSQDSVQQGRSTTLEAQVTPAKGSQVPGGTVTFTQGGNTVGTATLNSSGVGMLPLSSPLTALGTVSFSAQYGGDTLDAPGTSSTATATVTPGVDVLTYRNDINRQGVQAQETQLTPANVNTATFGLLHSYPVDSQPYAAPLYVSGYTMADGSTHNVVIVSTSGGYVYAFDADGKNPAQGYLWKVSLVGQNENPWYGTDIGCKDAPEAGTMSTPVIDRARGVIYVVSNTGNVLTYQDIFRLHALKISDGTEALNGPVVVSASVPGTAADGNGTTVQFNAFFENQRAALLEAEGSIWLAFASHCDIEPYHGWVVGYQVGNISQQTGLFNTTPNGMEGGVWMGSGGISADGLGNIYANAANGTFDGGPDYGDSVLKLAVPFGAAANTPLQLLDYFTPSNQQDLADEDRDLGTVDPMLIQDPNGKTPNLLVTADKNARVYFINRDNMGKYRTGSNGPDGQNGDLQDFSVGQFAFQSFAYFNNEVYLATNGSPLQSYTVTAGNATQTATIATTPTTESTVIFPAAYPLGGTGAVVSTNSGTNAVMWGVEMTSPNAVLYAFDPNNLGTMFYSSNQNPSRDQLSAGVKFNVPVVADGHVIVNTQDHVNIFGLLP